MSHRLEFWFPLEVILYFILSMPEMMHYVRSLYTVVSSVFWYFCEVIIFYRDITFFLLSSHLVRPPLPPASVGRMFPLY
jgi:hypothetical protein